jgi:membrane protein YdbS with pleckstrin-like domain
MHNPVENFGLIASLACVVPGAFLLYDGINSQFQVIGGATLLSVGLVVALLITKSRWQRTVWRYRRHLH